MTHYYTIQSEALLEQENEDEDDEEDDDDYAYEESVEEDAQENEAEHETGDELVATATEHDALSMISDTAGNKRLSAKELLLFPVPEEPEDDSELSTDEEPEWEPPAVRKHKVRHSRTNPSARC